MVLDDFDLPFFSNTDSDERPVNHESGFDQVFHRYALQQWILSSLSDSHDLRQNYARKLVATRFAFIPVNAPCVG